MKVASQGMERAQDVKKYMKEIKKYIRGYNLYDIFYGEYKNQETEGLNGYVETVLGRNSGTFWTV